MPRTSQVMLGAFFSLLSCLSMSASASEPSDWPDGAVTAVMFAPEGSWRNGPRPPEYWDRRVRFAVSDPDEVFRTANFQPGVGIELPTDDDNNVLPARVAVSFGGQAAASELLSESRKARATTPGADVVLGLEARPRAASDAGNLLGKSPSTVGISSQKRSPVSTDTRVRGQRVGQLLASGSFWYPARDDLDTALSKLDARLIDNMIVHKGPYAARYGPGFSFIDIELLPTPRNQGGFNWHGYSSYDFKSAGNQNYARTGAWGGGEDWGFRVSYGHRTGNDYNTGGAADDSFFQPGSIPSSYNSRYADVAIGADLSEDSHLEFNYLRLDQTGVEFPGLAYDVRYLVTDAYEALYVLDDPLIGDSFMFEGWYNRTRLEGDNKSAGKLRQIPAVGLFPGETDVDGASVGYRAATTWGEPGDAQLTIGTDMIYLTTQLNDLVDGAPPTNFPIPDARSVDVGLFTEFRVPTNDCTEFTLGARFDWVTTRAINEVPNFFGGGTMSDFFQAELDQAFEPWLIFGTVQRKVGDYASIVVSAGAAQRVPTLAELYAANPFMGVLQNNLTELVGDPELGPERLGQIDAVFQFNLPRFRGRIQGFHAWIKDYIAYDLIVAAGALNTVTVVNTDLATLAGGEVYVEWDFHPYFTGFGQMSYVEGRDHTRATPSRRRTIDAPGTLRSGFATAEEPLPGIPPLVSRVGLRLHEDSAVPLWAIELGVRIVDDQSRVATSLLEARTGGYTLWDVRAYWQRTDRLLLVCGCENVGDKFYREHLDSRAGRGVFQPGINFYTSVELEY